MSVLILTSLKSMKRSFNNLKLYIKEMEVVMKNIFIGFVFLFLDFNLKLGNSKIGLIPDFVGYMIMLNGLAEMARESKFFIKVKPYATGMTVYSTLIYIMDFFGASVSLGLLPYFLAFTSTIISLYISYNIVMGVLDMEEQYNTHLAGPTLKTRWQYLAIFSVSSFILQISPLAIICIIISIIVTIYFLVAFNKSKNLFYNIVR